MIRLASSLLVLALATPGFAADSGGVARVMSASPTTTYAGKKVAEDEILLTVGTLKSGPDGGAKLKLAANDVLIEIAANSEINLILPPSGDPSESIEIVRGKVRLRVPKAAPTEANEAKSDKPRFLLRHKKVTMGVRGTDFLAVANEELGETELVVFEGEVAFTNELAPKESRLIAAGNWSGIGGRFGDKVRAPLKLAPAGLAYFEKLGRDAPAYSIQAAPSEKAPSATKTSAPSH